MIPLNVNEHFFDEPSKEMMYVLGASYASAIPFGERGVEFRNKSGSLIDIIKYHLNSNHSVCIDSRTKSSAWLRMNVAPTLKGKLSELGVLAPKEERTFPKDIPSQFSDHFVRGFFDANASCGTAAWKRNIKYVSFSFNHDFLLGLHTLLAKETGLKRLPPTKNRLFYQNGDSIRLYNFIYRDGEYIQKEGLYLPEKQVELRSKE